MYNDGKPDSNVERGHPDLVGCPVALRRTVLPPMRPLDELDPLDPC